MEKSNFWKAVIIFFILTVMSGCAGQAFNKAKELNTVAAYNDFLKKYPDHESAKEAAELKRKAAYSTECTEDDCTCPPPIACAPCPQHDYNQLIKSLNTEIEGLNKTIIEQKTEIDNLKCMICLNTATKKEMKSVKGIGKILAKRIIAGRPYNTTDDLKKIKGIDQKELEDICSGISIKSE